MRAAILGLCLALCAFGSAEAGTLRHCVEAEAAYQAGDHGQEIDHYTRCIEEGGPEGRSLAIAHNNRGVAHHALGNPEAAIADFDRALALEPGYAMARTNRGLAQLAKGAFLEAMRDYDKAIALDPAYGPAYARRCWLFGYMGLGEAALTDCDASLDLNPDDPETLDSRAFAYWIVEDRELARRDLIEARRLDPARPSWQARFAEFELAFSVGYPVTRPPVQSAGHREPAKEPAREPVNLLR